MADGRTRSSRAGPWAARIAIGVAAGSWCVPAAANDPATATMLFNDARHLAAGGHYAEACPKFEASERLDPGIGTQYNLADCYEHVGKVASAWALFLDVASSAGGNGQEAREKVARKRAQALEAKVSKLTIHVPPALSGVAGLRVTRNGDAVDAVLWNAPVPVDPGSYTVGASASGRKDWSSVATVPADGASVTIAVPELERVAPAPATPAGLPGDTSSLGATGHVSSSSDAPALLLGPQRIGAIAMGGAGVIAIGVGAVFGIRSFSKHADYTSDCSGGGGIPVCSAAAAPLRDDAVAAGNVSTVSFLVGAALLGGGAALWFTAHPPRGPGAPASSGAAALGIAPMASRDSAGAMVRGRW